MNTTTRQVRGEQDAAAWNAAYPIGTQVIAYPLTRDDAPLYTWTRSRAWTLGHGEPVVTVEGYSGGICLSHVDAAGWVLTSENYPEIAERVDGDGVVIRPHWQDTGGRAAGIGMRIGGRPTVVAYWGDTIVRHGKGRYTVRAAQTGGAA